MSQESVPKMCPKEMKKIPKKRTASPTKLDENLGGATSISDAVFDIMFL